MRCASSRTLIRDARTWLVRLSALRLPSFRARRGSQSSDAKTHRENTLPYPPPHDVRGRGTTRRVVEGAVLLVACGYLPLPARLARHLPRRRGRKGTTLCGVCGQRVDNAVDDFLDQALVVAFAHDADHGLGAGRPDHQPAMAVEALFGV